MKILSILGQTKDELQVAALTRKAKALKRNQEKLIDDLEEKRDDSQIKKDKLLSVTVDSVNEKTWNTEYHEVIVSIALLEEEIKIAKNTLTELFTDGDESK